MKKNVVWWPAIVHKENAHKYGNYDYFEYTRKSWEYWCERNDVLFVPFTEPVEDDLYRFRPNWQKIIFVFDELDRRGIDYDQIFLADSSCMIKWNAPNVSLIDRDGFYVPNHPKLTVDEITFISKIINRELSK